MADIELRWVKEGEQAVLIEIASKPDYEWEHAEEYFNELTFLGHALVAFVDRRPVGYLLYQNIWGNTPFLSQVWIEEDLRRDGLGSRMVDVLVQRLQSEGQDSLTASNEEKNSGARAWCSKIGFKEIGTLEMDHGPEVFSVLQIENDLNEEFVAEIKNRLDHPGDRVSHEDAWK